MPHSDEPKYMMCLRVAGGPSDMPAVVRMCGTCGSMVWVTKVSLQIVEKRNCKIICNQCTANGVAGDDIELRFLPEQMEELREFLNKGKH